MQTTSPGSWEAWATVYTNNTGASVQGPTGAQTTTSPTTVVTATPSAAGAVGTLIYMFQAEIRGTFEGHKHDVSDRAQHYGRDWERRRCVDYLPGKLLHDLLERAHHPRGRIVNANSGFL